MTAIFWIVAICFVLVLAWFFVKVLIGALAPAQTAGRLYLKQELKKAGIDPRYIPDACLDEFVEETKENAELMRLTGRDYFKTEFVQGLDAVVDFIVMWRENPNYPFSWDADTGGMLYRDILQKHHVK